MNVRIWLFSFCLEIVRGAFLLSHLQVDHLERVPYTAQLFGRCILFFYHSLGTSPVVNGLSKGAGGLRGRYRIILASNRDEWLDRPTSPMHFWDDDGQPDILAGQDLQAGGTWLGVNRYGKLAMITNTWASWGDVLAKLTCRRVFLVTVAAAAAAGAAATAVFPRGTGSRAKVLGLLGLSFTSAKIASRGRKKRSRGGLVADYLKGDESAAEYCCRVSKDLDEYEGFSLLVGDNHGLWMVTNRLVHPLKKLPAGIYGLGNASLDTTWGKMLHGKSRVTELLLRLESSPGLSEDKLVSRLMDVLQDETPCTEDPVEDSNTPPRAGTNWLASLVPLFPFLRASGTRHAGGGGLRAQLQQVCIPPTPLPRSSWARVLSWVLPPPPASQPLPQSWALYGTRTATVVLVDITGRVKVVERNHIYHSSNASDSSCGSGGSSG
ncbi:unnamed protein product, partial [Discosporangium mesarthrocarpum]